MHINEIVKVFENLGIKVEIDNEGKMSFFDKDSDVEMKAFYTQNPLPLLFNEDIKPLVSVAELVNKGGFISITSPMKHMRFSLKNPRINRIVKKNDIVLNSVEYSVKRENGIDNYKIQLDDMSRNANVQISSFSNSSKHTSVSIFDEGYMTFDLDGKYGEFDTEFVEEYDLSSSEMIEIFNSNKLIPIFANYYETLYPGMSMTTNAFSQKKNSNFHM